jgi:DNA-binding transcriptional LysR family regulator
MRAEPGTSLEIDLRLLRAFVAVADELHFTRAAARLFVAQQALSRDIGRLERALGTRLFDRSTRTVQLTSDGRRLLPLARDVLAAHDALVAQMVGPPRRLVVDVVDERATPARILEVARERSPEAGFVARFGGGLGAALPALVSGQIDVAFGRVGSPGSLPHGVAHREVRAEPIALLVADDHPLADRAAVPLRELEGLEVDASVGNDAAPEWVEFAVGVLGEAGARPSPAHPHAVGAAETARHLREHGLPILTLRDTRPPPGAVIVRLSEAPTYAWSMLWRRGFRHAGLTALEQAAVDLASRESW